MARFHPRQTLSRRILSFAFSLLCLLRSTLDLADFLGFLFLSRDSVSFYKTAGRGLSSLDSFRHEPFDPTFNGRIRRRYVQLQVYAAHFEPVLVVLIIPLTYLILIA